MMNLREIPVKVVHPPVAGLMKRQFDLFPDMHVVRCRHRRLQDDVGDQRHQTYHAPHSLISRTGRQTKSLEGCSVGAARRFIRVTRPHLVPARQAGSTLQQI
jgi:hypothetical protein